MPRFSCLRALAAASLLALVHPAVAAEATRVASSGDEENPFDLDFSIKADYVQDRALITREYTYDYATGKPLSTVEERPEFRYTRRTFAILPRLAVGIWKDLEAHVEVPIILSSNTTWHYAQYHGASAGPTSATANNSINVDGGDCGGACPIFAGSGTVYHGSGFGDVKLGLAWGILSDARDDTKPFWLVGIDFIFPTAKMYEPGLDRTLTPGVSSSPYADAAKSGPFGENTLKVDFVTALSKRMGAADPYVKFHITSYRPSGETYSNCDSPELLSAAGKLLCADSARSKYGAKPPYVTGAAFGAEIVTGENKADGTRVALDFRLSADYTSSARWYDELTDMTGKLLKSEDYFSLQAFFGFYWRASKYMQLQATAHLGTETPHFITGEAVGDASYDPRYDAAGTRYRLTEVSDFGLAITGLLQF